MWAITLRGIGFVDNRMRYGEYILMEILTDRDYNGAIGAGWRSVLVDRDGEKNGGKGAVRDLRDVLRVLEEGV